MKWNFKGNGNYGSVGMFFYFSLEIVFGKKKRKKKELT